MPAQFDSVPESAAPRDSLPGISRTDELIEAAQRYGAFADFFERRPFCDRDTERQMMNVFNAIEEDLRIAVRRCLGHDGGRKLRQVLAANGLNRLYGRKGRQLIYGIGEHILR